MRSSVLDLLCCPRCKGPLAATKEGALCTECRSPYEMRAGVLDLTRPDVPPATRSTVAQFGASWQIHDHLAGYQRQQLADWMAPMTLDELRGLRVLEAGCGKGRHSVVLASSGPATLLSVDLSEAIFIAARNTVDFDNVACVRADLLDLPVRPASMDAVVCLGVLHHLHDPQAGLRALWDRLAPGGKLCLWVYGRERNGWIVHLIDPVRRRVTSRIPTRWLRPLLLPISSALYAALKLLYGPATRWGSKPARWLPYSAYLGYISRFPFREIEHIVLDHLCPPIAFYLSRPTLEKWFSELKPDRIEFRWHNRNSWNVVASKGK